MKTRIWPLLPTILVASFAAFAAGYLVNRLINRPLGLDDHLPLWIILSGMLVIAALIFTLGQRQMAALWRAATAREERDRENRRAIWRQMAETVHQTLTDLADRYDDTPEDRLHIHIVYHRDTFAALSAALEEVPVHQLGSVEATVAWCGLRKNLRDAQVLADLYIACPSRGNASTPRPFARIDLRQCKAFAEIHYMNFMRAMPR